MHFLSDAAAPAVDHPPNRRLACMPERRTCIPRGMGLDREHDGRALGRAQRNRHVELQRARHGFREGDARRAVRSGCTRVLTMLWPLTESHSSMTFNARQCTCASAHPCARVLRPTSALGTHGRTDARTRTLKSATRPSSRTVHAPFHLAVVHGVDPAHPCARGSSRAVASGASL